MARLDVYELPGNPPRYVMDVQSDLLSYLATRAVVPLLPQSRAKTPVKGLNPAYEIGDDWFVVITQEIAVMPKKHLRTRVASLSDHHDEILRALDILFTGF